MTYDSRGIVRQQPDGARVKIIVPSRFAGNEASIRRLINYRMTLTAQCANDWHDTAPARAIDLCPECVQ